MYEAEKLNLSYEQLRSVMIEMLREGVGGQLTYLKTAVPTVAMRMGLMANPEQQSGMGLGGRIIRHGGMGSQVSLSNHDYGRVLNIFGI